MSELEFDPTIHRLFLMDVDVNTAFFVVATDKAEAEEVAASAMRDEIHNANWNIAAAECRYSEPLRWMGTDLPWGPITWRGKELTVNDVIELLNNPPGPDGEPVPPKDTLTMAMPFMKE